MNNLFIDYDIDFSLIENISKDLLYKYCVLPIQQKSLYLLVATSNKNINIEKLIEIFKQPVKLFFVSKEELEFIYKNIDFSISLYMIAKNSLQKIDNQKESSLIEKFFNVVFEFCIQNSVSDIHIETLEKEVIIRFRIDGVLNQFFKYEKALYPLLSSVIKLYGNLDISQKRLPTNSAFSKNILNKDYDFRISTLPSIYGESIVLRILDNQNIQKDIEKVGFDKNSLKIIKENLKLNQGLILVTGPTGSGKTTTLYSMLSYINNKQRKIITIEDPVEYKLKGIVQVNINEDIDLGYSKVLKNILRQDPDILMIGEIRDSETLAIALRAALTGHLVIATLHTNNCHDTLTRLLDLNAPSYLISTTVKLIISQRLVRILCPICKKYDQKTDTYIPCGCKECNLSGYKKRDIVSEILQIDKNISDLISDNQSLNKILSYSKNKGFKSLKNNAKELVAQGETSLEEFYGKI